MAITRLERKLKRARAKSKRRVATIKRLNAQPPVKNIDIEAIKAEFEKNASKGKKAAKKEAPEAAVAEEPKVAPKAEAPAAKEAPKAKAKKEEEAGTKEEKPKKKAAPKAEKKEEKEG